MSLEEIVAVGAIFVLSLGGGAAIVFALSSWLGKVWANRLMQKEQAQHSAELERLRVKLEKDTSTELAKLKSELEVIVATRLRETQDKLAIYRATVDIVADILGDFDRAFLDGVLRPDARDRFDLFNRGRMRAYGYMVMLAPQPVVDAFDALVDQCLRIYRGEAKYDWTEIRQLAIALLNEMRKDVGIDKFPIEYRGDL